MERSRLQFIAAWTFLNVLMNIGVCGPNTMTAAVLLPSTEVLVLMAATAAAAQCGVPFRAGYYVPVIGAVLFLRLFTLADVLVPAYMNRRFNLCMDTAYFPQILQLIRTSVSPAAFTTGLLLLGVLLAALCHGLHKALAIIHAFFRTPRGRRHFGTTAAALLLGMGALQCAAPAGVSGPAALGRMRRVAEEFCFIFDVGAHRRQLVREAQRRETRGDNDPSAGIRRLNDNDVYLFVIESYGHTVFANPDHLHRFRPALQRFENDMAAAGFGIVSNFLESPVYGGMSWLAHATLISGLRIDNQIRYQSLLGSGLPTAVAAFNAAGYRTLCAMPGTNEPWPGGAFFGYSRIYTQSDFGYRGPTFGWSAMPDQVVIDVIRRRELQNRRQPLFVNFVLGNSHAPFNVLPTYFPDWSRIGDGAVFHGIESVSFAVTWSDMTHAAEAYIAALVYEFQIVTAFLENWVSGDALIIITGDHQPNLQVTGPGRPWSVPVHVISRNRFFLDPLVRRGYMTGAFPSQPPPHLEMAHALSSLLTSLSVPSRSE